MGYTSWGQRRALGRRYSVDPALLMEQERLEREYALMPSRFQQEIQQKQLAQSESQYARSLREQQKARESQEKSAKWGTAGNVLTTGMMLKALYKTPPPVEQVVNPALVDTAGVVGADYASGLGLAADAGMGLAGSAETGAAAAAQQAGATAGAEAAGGTGIGGAATVGGLAALAALSSKAGYEAGKARMEESSPGEWDYALGEVQATPYSAAFGLNIPGILSEKALGESNTLTKNLSAPITFEKGMAEATTKVFEGDVSGAWDSFVETNKEVMSGLTFGLTKKAGTVICTELHRQGLLDDKVYQYDAEYRKFVDEQTYTGYRILAQPIVSLMQKSKSFTRIFAPFAIATATEMAGRVNPEIQGSNVGKAMLRIFTPLCRLVGKMAIIPCDTVREGRC